MTESEILALFEKVGMVFKDSHFVYTSGLHGSSYVNKDALYPHALKTYFICNTLARQFGHDAVETVIAPAMGGVILSQWVAYHLTMMSGISVMAVFAEKSEDGKTFDIKRGYDRFITGKRVLVVEDILTTGDSAKRVVEAARACGGHVVGIGALFNRGEVTPHDVGDVPKFSALISLKQEAWDEISCPLCTQNIPINTTVGKGSEFLDRKKK